MRALIQDRYGEPAEVLSVREVEQPTPAEHQVLVRVKAASIHIGDCYVIRGVPYAMRPVFGLRRPRSPIPGMDMAGIVEQVGPAVTRFSPGDEVFGTGTGAFAEYAVVDDDHLAPAPANLGFEAASTVGVSAQTALQALRDHLQVSPGHKVLITGASGGVGTFAVQIAKSLGAEVTAVCSTRNIEMVRSIGADHVIDYTAEDFTRGEERYDAILDNAVARAMSATRAVLTPTGKLLSNGARVGGWFGGLGSVAQAFVVSLANKQQARPFVQADSPDDRVALKSLVEEGRVTPVIDKTFALDQGGQAVAHVNQGHAQGKTVITI